ncbi:MAG: hypothetical protein EOP45_22960 [Sphingobacteriaceae bacterium]|nr:MAG: hypothetical protein EOP45_22960 [Sphingobacteriaceae bacterium]
MMVIQRLPKLAPLLQKDPEDIERTVSQMDLNTLMNLLDKKQQQVICLKFNQSSLPILKTVLYDMKEFNQSAHPTTLFGKPVTYNVAKAIAAKTTRRARRIVHSNLPKIEQTQIYAESAVLGLYEIRKTQPGWKEGQTLLYNCE